MNTIRITDEITQITRQGWMNCFLVREPDGFTLVDTTLGGFADEILATARAAGAPIRRILLTHAHGDHVGSVDALVKATAAELAISARESRLLARDFSLLPDEAQTKIRGSLPKVNSQPQVLLREDERYGSLRAIATPGHTPGHMSFLDERSGTLLAGDSLCSIGPGLRVIVEPPWYFPFPKMANWHPPTAIGSATRLSPLGISTIVCGHGHPITDGARSLAAALARCAT